MAGADPSFGETHVLRTLFALESAPIGRKRLVRLLGVGEGSARTIIKRLSGQGLISSSKAGHKLTDSGKALLCARLSRMSRPELFDSGGLVSGSSCLVIVYGAEGKVGSAVPLRDAALKAGADGAVILVERGGTRFPDSSMDLTQYPAAKARIEAKQMKDGDVAVIGFSASQSKAEDGALAVALLLI